MIATEHALALFLFIGVPIWDVLETRALKTSTNPRRKILTYQRIVLVEWAAALVAWIVLRSQVFLLWSGGRHSALQKLDMSFVLGLVLAFTIGSLLQAYLTRRNAKLRQKTLGGAFKRLAFILPLTREERAWFAAVSVTAGVCEEVLYRGFLIRYLTDFPWHAGLLIALGISSIAFGMAHGYQGLTGILGTAFLGAFMAVIFVVTGSLWLPIALHAIIDLRVLFLLRPGDLMPLAASSNA
ncbi:MAG TPA: CPBP family intramembrane glutamic endopeptidase [Terriglobales bacterium]|nr:CPBP family intramembrane glutamic endopeptidase [Terriglobales bacterium]